MTCSRHYDILVKTRSKLTTAIRFSRQNDAAGSRVSNTQHWENLVLVVVLFSESEALYIINNDPLFAMKLEKLPVNDKTIV